MSRADRTRPLAVIEYACWAIAGLLIAVYAAARFDADVNGERDLALAVEAMQSHVEREWADAARGAVPAAVMAAPAAVTEAPIATTEAPAATSSDELVGFIAIPSLDLSVPLYTDTSEVHLNRGAGLIPAMARPGQHGNVGVAAHRDAHFRPLEHIRPGAEIELGARGQSWVYRVTDITIVDRSDAALLHDVGEPVITLVTCYPFRYVGRAPQRFVVRGELVPSPTTAWRSP